MPKPPLTQAERIEFSQNELAARIAHALQSDGSIELLGGMIRLRRFSAPTEIGHGVSYPAFCVIAQGSKEVLLGEERFRYDPANYLIVTSTLPIASRITEAAPDLPFLSVLLRLDPFVVGSVMVEAGYPAPQSNSALRAININPLNADLLEAVVRLMRLLDTPAEARLLAPLVTREIVYRLLRGEQGSRLCQIAALNGEPHRIGEAINRLRNEFDRPIRIDDLAQELGMSVSGFHHHFKEVTAMSPLEFQKQLRLQEARRLMLGEGCDAATAGYRVGYGDASHFTREYKRLFGAPPKRDVYRLRGISTSTAGL